MFKNYFKLALRNIARRKLYTVINLTGLSVASAFCILVYWYVQHENSFDKFQNNAGSLYRIEFSNFDAVPPLPGQESKPGFFSFLMKDAEQQNMIQTPVIFSGELKKNFHEIEHAVRIQPGYQIIVRVKNQSFKENNAAFADKDFFSVFNFPLVEGNAASVLSGRNQIVLSEKIAKKYFGKEEALGKTISLPNYENTLYTVSGVAKDFPANSSFQYDLIIPRESVPWYADEVSRGLNTFSDLLIVQLRKGTDADAFAKKLDAFGGNYFQPTLKEWAATPGSMKPENFHVYIRPFADAHYNVSSGWGHYTDLKNIYQLCSLAIVILLIACLNYILLTLTGTVSRSGEVGIRKTIGAPRRQIILQFYTETQLLAFFAVITGFVLAFICLPLFGNLIGSDLQFSYFSLADISLLLIGLAFVLGILAGVYPALVMSGLKPLNMMRRFSVFRLNPLLSRGLMITQFSVCIILIISSLVISGQMRYMNATELGFDKDQVITVENPFLFDAGASKTYQLKERLVHFASEEPSIENVTANGFPFGGYNNTSNHIINGEKTMVQVFDIDYNYFSFFKIHITKGRAFSADIKDDSTHLKLTDAQTITGSSAARQAVVVNETLYNLLGRPQLDEFNKEIGGPIIGVCKDYHSDDFTKKISPAYHRIYGRYIGNFSMKIKAGQNIPAVIDKIKTNWNSFTGNEPFSFTFLDQHVQKSYEAYLRWMQTVTASCLLAIIIASLGLFGLSGLTAISRIKEIGIRKVLGASSASLFLMLNKSTFIMALISFVVAVPVAGYLVNQWLQNFAYHITPGWSVYTLALIISIVTAFIAVSYHAIKTANANPVKSLRTE